MTKTIHIYKNTVFKTNNTSCSNVMERKKKLIEKLNEMKIEYIKGNICDVYIKYGYPDIDDVIKDITKTHQKKNKRMYKLINKLKKNGLEYDETIPAYNKYISKGGNIKKTIDDGELEKILIKETNYLSILNNADSDTAKDVSINNFICKGGKNKLTDKYMFNKNTIKFE